MALIEKALRTARDWQTMGPAFCLQGIKRLRGRGIMPISLPGGTDAYVRREDSDFETFRQVFVNREYDVGSDQARARLHQRYDAILASGGKPVIVDAGANIGAASRWFLTQFPRAALVAIEPDPDNAAVLRRNLAPFADAVVLEAAIGSSPGSVTLARTDKSWAVQTQRGAGACPVVTVKEAVATIPGGVCFIVKVDIEGFESDLFAANTEWIDETFAMMIEPHDWMLPGGGSSYAFQQEMGRRRFEIFLRGENIVYVRP